MITPIFNSQMCDQITCPISDWISTCKVKGAPANVDLTYCLQIEDNCDAFKYSKCDIDETVHCKGDGPESQCFASLDGLVD